MTKSQRKSNNPETEKRVRMLIHEDEFRTDKALEEFKKASKEKLEVRWQLFAKLIKKSIIKILFERYSSHKDLECLSKDLDVYLDIMQHRDDMSDLLIQHNNDGKIAISFTMYGGLHFLFKVLVLFSEGKEYYDLRCLEYMLQYNHKNKSSKLIDIQENDVLDRIFNLFKGDITVQCKYPLIPEPIINDVLSNYTLTTNAEYEKYMNFICNIRDNSKQVLLLSEEENEKVELLIAVLTFAKEDPTIVTTISRVSASEDFVCPLYNFYREVIVIVVGETKTAEGVEKLHYFYFLEYYKYEVSKKYQVDNKKTTLAPEYYYVLLRIQRQVETIKYSWEEMEELDKQTAKIQ